MPVSRPPRLIFFLVAALTLAPGAPHAADTEAPSLSGSRVPAGSPAPGFPGPGLLPSGDLGAAVRAFAADELPQARRELETLLKRRGGDSAERARAHFLLGWIALQLGHHQQASANFYRVRKLEEHPLREMATYLEAESDRRRGHPRTAIEECDAYLDEFPDGRFADECRLTQAHANADLGKLGLAVKQFQEFLERHPDDQRAEALWLRIAAANEALGRREAAAKRYRALYIHHQLPSTGRVAEEALRRLEASGTETEPLRDIDLYTRACALRRTGQFDASYDLFCELDERNPSTGEGATDLGRRLENERHDFLWRNRKYLEVGRWNGGQYDKDPDSPDAVEHLHWAVRGYSKSGRWEEAVRYHEYGVKRFGNHSRFRGREERAALLYVAAGKYAEARSAYQAWQKRSGRARRSTKVRFFVAYCAYRAGDLDTAIAEFSELVKKGSSYRTAAFWYRSKAYDKQGKTKEARADRATVVQRNPDGWYALLVKDRDRRKKGTAVPGLRDGRWPSDPPRAVPPPPPPSPPASEAIARLLDGVDRSPERSVPDVLTREDAAAARDPDGRLLPSPAAPAWPVEVRPTEPVVFASAERSPPPAHIDPTAVPTTWRASPYWNEAKGAELWRRFAETNAHLWPDLPRAYELSRIGLGEQAGGLLAEIFAEAKKVRRSKKIKRRVARWRAAEAKKAAAAAKKAAAAKAAAAKKAAEEAAEEGEDDGDDGDDDGDDGDVADGDDDEDVSDGDDAPAGGDDDDSAAGSGSAAAPAPKPVPSKISKEARWAAILDLEVKNKDWMAIFAAAGSPSGVSDFAVNSIPYAKLPRGSSPEVAAAWTMTYPAAFGPHVWKHSRAANVDPLLMLSIMRAESLFRHDAVSHAGALGLVQVMPATGSKVAALAGMNDFRVERLLDPAVNIELGTFYLGKLLERYDGQFALAVGSYNGGPHNIGRWLRGKVGMDYDEFVEEIAFDETRGYIKKVTSFYAIYCDLYAGGVVPEIPLKTTQDDASIIDF